MLPLPLLLLPAALLLFVGLVALSLVRHFRTARLSGRALVDLCPSGDAPEEALAHLELVGDAMGICGFVLEHELGSFDSTAGASVAWFRSWTDPTGRTRAVASTVVGRDGRGEVSQVSLLSQVTIAGERRTLETDDAPVTSAWRLPRRQSVRLPGATPETLWHIHRARLATLPAQGVHPLADDLASVLARDHREVVETGVERGHLRPAEPGTFAYTRSGVWAAAKCMLPPWSTRRDHADRRAADEWLVNL